MSSYRGSLRIAATNDVIDAMFVVDEDQLTVNTGEDTLGNWPLDDLAPDDTGTQVLLALDGERVIIEVPDHASFVAALNATGRKRKRRRDKREKAVSKPAKGPKSTKPKRAPKAPKRKPKVVPPPEPVATSVPEPEPAPEPAAEPASIPEPERTPEPAAIPEPEIAAKQPFRIKPAKRARTRRNPADTIRTLLDRDTWREWLSDRVVRWVIASFAVIIVALLALFATNSLGMILVLIGMVILVVVALAVSEDLTAYSWIPGNISETTLVIAGVAAMAIGGLLILIG
ncbi:MAG: hypothetical protein QNJ75_10020 [Acidimicrobiia bacterium]|nr:hypothetical protein [Acidimicrobiia bacterium]